MFEYKEASIERLDLLLGRTPLQAVQSWLTLSPSMPANIRQNLLAGIVVGVIAFPLSIALAVAVGVPPISGLYTAVIAGGIAAAFGGSRFNITGPTAALVPVLSHAVVIHGPKALPLLGLMAGVMLLVMSALRAGRLVRYIPGTVVVGFTAGIALSIAFGQLNNLLNITGTDASLEHFHARVWDSARHLETVGFTTPAIGALALAILVVWPRLPRARAIPGPLIVVVVTTALTWYFGLDVPTVESKYGAIPQELPSFDAGFIDIGLIFDLLPLAVSVAILAGVESLLSAVVADGMSGGPERHEPDNELRGQGLANVAASLLGGIPSTAAIARTAAGIRSGATSRLTGVVHAVTVLAGVLLVGDVAGRVPMAALAAILLIVAWNIAEVPEVSRLLRKSARGDAFVLVSTILITLFFDLTYAIGFGIIASMVLLLRQLIRYSPGDARALGAHAVPPRYRVLQRRGRPLVLQCRRLRIRTPRPDPQSPHPPHEGCPPHRCFRSHHARRCRGAPAEERRPDHPHRDPAGNQRVTRTLWSAREARARKCL
ncbi:MAG: sodium-independent anion transporter [Dehalococcoidia bacterium]|nr:sodium-independent anion transporter [Dehalococcoidia bacterium]